MKTQQSASRKIWLGKTAIAGLAAAAFSAATVGASAAPPPGRTIAYAVTDRVESTYETKDAKEECPDGLYAMGAREQFADSFPNTEGKKADGTRWTVAETSLARETEVWFPNLGPGKYPTKEVKGKISFGLNLDGKVKDSDFTAPDGTPGIDNQFYRATGCIESYRDGSSQRLFYTEFLESRNFNRTVIELTDVDSLENDDDVVVTTYRGLDTMAKDAKGEFAVDATQRVDGEFGQYFVRNFKAKIVDGTLISSQPGEFVWPNENHTDAATEIMRDARFQMKLTPEKMDGIVAGYLDVETTYRASMKRYGTHQASYGKLAGGSIYKTLRKLADAYPDPKTGENTAISGALSIKGVRVQLVHPDKKVADVNTAPQLKRLASAGE